MVKFKNGLQGNLTVPLVEEGAVPEYQTFPLTAFHRLNDKGNKKPIPGPIAAVRGRNFEIENKK